jgi:thiamine pyrophosphokinase
VGAEMKRCLIFAGGDFSDDFRDPLLFDKCPVICADRGLVHAQKLGIVPDVIVGDFDSYEGELPPGAEIHRSIPEKDDTDTMLAVKIAIERCYDSIVLFGGLGGRFDHTFANIQTMRYAFEHGCDMSVSAAENLLFIQGAGSRRYARREDWYFSVFALTPEVRVNELSGVKYELRDYTLTDSFPLGVSNEITADEAVVDIADGIALIVYSKR